MRLFVCLSAAWRCVARKHCSDREIHPEEEALVVQVRVLLLRVALRGVGVAAGRGEACCGIPHPLPGEVHEVLPETATQGGTAAAVERNAIAIAISIGIGIASRVRLGVDMPRVPDVLVQRPARMNPIQFNPEQRNAMQCKGTRQQAHSETTE